MQVEITTNDGVAISTTHFQPTSPPVACVLIAPAMGVSQGFYKHFAEHLANHGLAVLTLDYRGIGDSKRGGLRRSTASLADWGRLDLQACMDWLRDRHPNVPFRWVGHSVGGQLLGLVDSAQIDRALLIASQSGYWRLWSGAQKAKMWMYWYVAVPMVTRMFGSLPAALLGGGAAIPPKVARQWAEWGRDPRYIAGYVKQQPENGFASFRGSLRAYAFSDDSLAPMAAVRALVDEFHNVEGHIESVSPGDHEMQRIGHFGALRRSSAETLWPELTAWLLALAP